MISKSLSFSFAIFAAPAFAATPAIGIVTASGHVMVERSEVWGNSTLFDGATVETKSASSEMSLRNGVRLQLGAASRAQVWANRIALERGVGQVAGKSYELDAASLKISGGDAARFRVTVGDRVDVVAFAGAARVTNRAGLVLASVPAGGSMSFALNAGQGGSTVTRTGCLLFKDGHFILQDDNTQEVAEVNGRDLAANVGNRVEIAGTAGSTKPAVSIATLVLTATRVTMKSQGGCLSSAAALNAQTEAPAGGASPATTASAKPVPGTSAPASTGGGGGMSTGAKVAIVAVIAGGGAGAAIALAGHKSSTSP